MYDLKISNMQLFLKKSRRQPVLKHRMVYGPTELYIVIETIVWTSKLIIVIEWHERKLLLISTNRRYRVPYCTSIWNKFIWESMTSSSFPEELNLKFIRAASIRAVVSPVLFQSVA